MILIIIKVEHQQHGQETGPNQENIRIEDILNNPMKFDTGYDAMDQSDADDGGMNLCQVKFITGTKYLC